LDQGKSGNPVLGYHLRWAPYPMWVCDITYMYVVYIIEGYALCVVKRFLLSGRLRYVHRRVPNSSKN
jgi:hypothetical protein